MWRTVGRVIWRVLFGVLCWYGSGASGVARGEPSQVRLANDPALSPDGAKLAIAWSGDIWLAASEGGTARQLTTTQERESSPIFSPDGAELAFISNRSGSEQLFVMKLDDLAVRQITFHSEGCSVLDWQADGNQLLISAARDHFWRAANRFFLVDARQRAAEQLLFDDYGQEAKWSPDGRRLLFTREGERWWRQGYRGSRASQVWLWDRSAGTFRKLIQRDSESRSPLWKPDSSGFYYVSGQDGCQNLWEFNLADGAERQITNYTDDSVVQPALSRDGTRLVYRLLFDLYGLRPGVDEQPRKIEIVAAGDAMDDNLLRRRLDTATDAAFTSDGLEVAFIAGGDVWVMDTELREPKQVTNTAEEEREPVFSPDNQQLLFVSDQQGQCDIWQASRASADKYWWQNDSFTLNRLTNDAELEGRLKWSPAGDQLAFLRARGDLWVMKPAGQEARRVVPSWNDLSYDWSPDGKWLVYAQSDDDFNRDVFLLPLDGSRGPYNISRHPDNDDGPVWSPDGKAIAFTSRRRGEEVDIHYVYLQQAADDQDRRDRTMDKAIDKIRKSRKDGPAAAGGPAANGAATSGTPASENDVGKNQPADVAAKPGDEQASGKKLPVVQIDFDDLHRRLRHVAIVNSGESGLFWSHDSSKLAFNATVDGKSGTYTIAPPDDLQPKLLSPQTGRNARWIAHGNQILWLAEGKPGSLSASGSAASFGFSCLQTVDQAARYEAAFDQCWRAMRDGYYDGNLNGRNWDAVRRKYTAAARNAADHETFATVVHLMLGELNGSHLGVAVDSAPPASPNAWRETTAHLGLRFEPSYRGPGWRVRDVIPQGPAAKASSRLEAGEIVLAIDGRTVDPGLDVAEVLNGAWPRDLRLRVRNAKDEEREVLLRPYSYADARSGLYEQWVRDNQAAVEKLSAGKLGYVHIRGMDLTSFYRFEEELFAVAAGKDGLVIDVRDNGGGSTTDHLLTILTQPAHAITVPRGGGPGYPQDRSVYATWRKPVVVLCNQNSYSNAEIFSHAIKHLKRGKLVGVPTAGGVVSTGAKRIMDVATLRMPSRGWYLLSTGQDMELNGAVPHAVLWPLPGELPAGTDRQLERAVKVLAVDVERWRSRPPPKLIPASERAHAEKSAGAQTEKDR